jgi:hypothetical protein
LRLAPFYFLFFLYFFSIFPSEKPNRFTMAAPAEKKEVVEEVEPDSPEKTAAVQADQSSDSDSAPLERAETSMNRAKWLACIALCLAYTTAYQQNACTAAILKHIDEELGKLLALLARI